MEFGSEQDPLIKALQQRIEELELLPVNAAIIRDMKTDLTGLQGTNGAAEISAKHELDKVVTMSPAEFAAIPQKRQNLLRRLVAERMAAGPLVGIWRGCPDNWIAVDGGFDNPRTIFMGGSTPALRPVDDDYGELQASQQTVVWIVERPSKLSR